MRTASRSVSSVVQPSLPHAKPPAPRRKLTLSSWLPLLGSLALLGCQTHTLQPLKAGSILPLRSVRCTRLASVISSARATWEPATLRCRYRRDIWMMR